MKQQKNVDTPAQAADTTTDTPTTNTPAQPEISSPLLDELKKERIAIAAKLRSEDVDAQLKAIDEMTIVNAKIKSEEASIRKAIADAKLAEERNARVALADDLINAVLKAYGVAKKDRSPETDAKFAEQRDVIVTELLARYATSKPAKKASDGTKSAGTRGATTSAIRELIAPMYTNGIDGSEVRRSIIKDHGFNDGTANAVILAYEKEIGLK